jgi:Alw26I/Eco31I/Esp3I family type II restriction endonuclease
MADNSRKNHQNFVDYQEFIVAHKNCEDLHFTRNAKDNSIRWVVTGKSEEGQKRRAWYVQKCKELGIKVEAGAFSKVAVAVHPTKEHTCQICGKKLSILYVYPNKNLLKKIADIFEISFDAFEKDIFEIIREIPGNQENKEKWIDILKAPKIIKSIEELCDWIKENHVKTSSKSFLSPGVMSNPPDRYDGFHSDGNCCRSKADKGRHKANLQRYGQDRRVYENWADGDWKQADRLMSKYREFGLSADHIGPISLGFCHRPKFHPLTREKNSAKNNRMSFDDVKSLIVDEQNGEQVVSWHSKYIWDLLKNGVKNDEDAVKLSTIMRTNLHWVLSIFAQIDEQGYRDYLMRFLNLDYSDFDYTFPEFTPENVGKIVQKAKKGKNQANNKERYVRVAFESLDEYKNKENRRTKDLFSKGLEIYYSLMYEKLAEKKYDIATRILHIIFQKNAKILANNWQKV